MSEHLKDEILLTLQSRNYDYDYDHNPGNDDEGDIVDNGEDEDSDDHFEGFHFSDQVPSVSFITFLFNHSFCFPNKHTSTILSYKTRKKSVDISVFVP